MVTSFSLATRSKFPKNPYALCFNLSFRSHNFSGDDHHFEAFIKSSPGPSIVVINKHLADLVDHKHDSDVISRWKVVRGYGIIGCNFTFSTGFEFYREAKKNGLELNRISCSTLIQGLCKSGLVRDAMKLLLKEFSIVHVNWKGNSLAHIDKMSTYSKMRSEACQLLNCMKSSYMFDELLSTMKVELESLSVDDVINFASKVSTWCNYDNVGTESSGRNIMDDIQSSKQRVLTNLAG
ncbi:TATA-binding protein-associated factor BTAF1 isoform X1 [Senna tora]|uniref:TATA-binding protein-associated factor BTAF1 isoform X1 n=1 Tax=Senna tora TaxID=362788 RepID=A0A834TMV7_9FABA|nr:TATA-binding protein-associated factor BTAF1 isoform X1 [Senna tora]